MNGAIDCPELHFIHRDEESVKSTNHFDEVEQEERTAIIDRANSHKDQVAGDSCVRNTVNSGQKHSYQRNWYRVAPCISVKCRLLNSPHCSRCGFGWHQNPVQGGWQLRSPAADKKS